MATHPPPTPTLSWIDPAEARSQIRAWAAGRVEVRHAEPVTLIGQDGIARQVPLALIEDRPDLRNFVCRHRLDGDGCASYAWKFLMAPGHPSFAAIRCNFTAPVKRTISLVFDMRQHAAFLATAAQCNTIFITPRMGMFAAMEMLRLEDIGTDLAQAMAVFRLGEQMHRAHQKGKRR